MSRSMEAHFFRKCVKLPHFTMVKRVRVTHLRKFCPREVVADALLPYFAALALPALLDSGRGSMVTERAALAVPVFQP